MVDFYARTFGIRASFVDLDVQVPGRVDGEAYHFAALDVGDGGLHLATHALGTLLMPTYSRPPDGKVSGVEVGFYAADVAAAFARAVDSGAEVVAEPAEMPWGQTVSYVRSIEGTFVGLCSRLPEGT